MDAELAASLVHSADERIAVDDLELGVDLFRRVATTLESVSVTRIRGSRRRLDPVRAADGHDAYWAYRDAFFELLPPAPARALEIGRDEGRVSRDLRSRAYDVTGLDVAPTLVDAARDADPHGAYVVGDAAALPFDDGLFDLVVSYNSLIDVEDMRVAVAEAGPVLRPGGCLCACVPHPFSEAGEFESGADDAAFVVKGSYLVEADYEFVERPGRDRLPLRKPPFLESYSRALENAGLAVEALRAPRFRRREPPSHAHAAVPPVEGGEGRGPWVARGRRRARCSSSSSRPAWSRA